MNVYEIEYVGNYGSTYCYVVAEDYANAEKLFWIKHGKDPAPLKITCIGKNVLIQQI